MKTYYNVRVVKANNKDEAIKKIQDQEFYDAHPLCDIVHPIFGLINTLLLYIKVLLKEDYDTDNL